MAEACTSNGFPVERLIMLIWPILIGFVIFNIVRRRKNNPSILRGKMLPEKSKYMATLMAFLCGVFGTHRFYLGYLRQGCIQAAGFICLIAGAVISDTCTDGSNIPLLLIGLACAIWVLTDAFRILSSKLLPADGSKYKEDRPLHIIQEVKPADSPIETLEKLAKLHAQGALTDEEFEKKKSEILTRI